MRLLLVEDDESLGGTLKERLEGAGYFVELATSAQAARAALKSAGNGGKFDLGILDIGLPDGSGLGLAREFKEQANLPVVFLTAMNSASFRLEGFELGAEDYIPKPFHMNELLLRVRRVLERLGVWREKPELKLGAITLEPTSLAIVDQANEREFLPQRDFMLLYHLVSESPRAFSREEIIKQIWGDSREQSGRTVDNSILRLRQILKRHSADQIQAVRGVGYRWV